MPRPYFIVLEGIDGSGTTSQCQRLTQRLRDRGHEVLETRQPSRGVIGRMIRDHLAVDAAPMDRAALALLFAADRLHHLQQEIDPALAAGQIVVCDRYVLSSWAYQSLDAPLEWVREINRRARWPDLTLFVDVSAATGLARVQARQAQGESTPEFFEVPELQRRLETTYRELAADPDLSNIVRIDGELGIDEVSAAIYAAVDAAGV